MQSSFGATRPGEALSAIDGGRDPMAVAAPAPVASVAEAVTTRDRIVNRALATPQPERPAGEPAAAPAAGVVVDLAAFRDRRRQREPEPPATQPTARGPPAPVVEPTRKPEIVEPDRGEAAASEAPAEAGPAVSAAPAVTVAVEPPEGEAAPSAEAAPALEEAKPAAPEGAAAPQPAAAAAAAAEPAAAPAAPAVIRNPEDEPGFQAMKERTQRAAVRTKRHQTGREAADIAQGASAPDPVQDVNSQAAAERVGTMAGTEPGEFDADDFKRDVKAAIEGMAPPATLEEADEFKKTGKAAGATSTIQQLVLGGRDESQQEIKDENVNPPDPEGKDPKPVSDMVDDKAGPPLPGVGAAEALPGRRPAEQIDVSFGPLQVEAKMLEANVTEEQLANANEPEFFGALDARREVREHAEADPANYRLQEGLVLGGARTEAEGAAVAQLEGMHGARVGTLGAVVGAKDETKRVDQQAHEEVHAALLDIHTRTQEDVTTILETLDTTVDTIFTTGEKAARDRFEEYVDQKMRAYKADRYGGRFGGFYWAKDKLFDLPDEVNDFYRDGRADYLAAMDRVIDLIAALVGVLLGAAKLRIEAGRAEVKTYLAGLDESRRSLGDDAAADLDNRFDQLDSDVDSKRDELVDTVARKYVESRDGLDERIKELQEANKGLVSKAIDAVVGVLKTIYELGKLLLRVLLKAAAAIGDIIAHPIRFLENLIGGVKGGLDRFVERIDVHLQKSLLDLLFGELGSAGITMPGQLDFAGILDLVLQVIGLTYAGIRERLVKRFGEETVAGMEEKVDIFKTLVKDGVAGLWTWIKEKLADLEDLVIGKIKEYIIERVIKAGIGYIVALLNPVAAFIKACQGIYQIVMFIVERAKQIAAFVEAILDSISAMAQGNVSVAVEKVESALANGLSLAIAFLARLANLGALSEKMRSIIALVRKPITRVVDKVVFGAAQIYRRTVGPAVAFGKAKLEAGREWAKGKVEAGKEWALKKVEAVKVRVTGRDLADEDPADADPKPRVDDDLAHPIRVAEESIDVAPGEQHTVFVQLAPTGKIDIGLSSTPQLVTDLVEHFGPRIDTLPATAPARLPKGGEKGDQPRIQAKSAATRILKSAAKLDLDFERDFEARLALHRAASFKGFASVYEPDVRLTSRLGRLGTDIQVLLRMFYAYDNPRFARAEDEPARGQKLTGRVWAVPGAGGEILPEGPARGVQPTLARRPGSHLLEPAPHLVAPTRGAVREPGAERARGVVLEPDASRREIVVRSWAIGGKPPGGSNASHTENQFYHWLVAQGEEFHRRITAIELRSVLSPCGDCTTLLTGISRLVRDRPPGTRPASLVVFWDNVYGNEEGDVGPAAATFRRHVVYLGDAGWIVHGPTPPA